MVAYGIGKDATYDGRAKTLSPDATGRESLRDPSMSVIEEGVQTLRAQGPHFVAYGIRSDAQREGAALAPSPDAEGRVRLRDPGLGITEGLSPTLDVSGRHAVAFLHMNKGRPDGRQSAHEEMVTPKDHVPAITTRGPAGAIVIPFETDQITHPENRSRCEPGSPAPTLARRANAPAVAISVALRGREGGGTAEIGGDIANALRGANGGGSREHVLAFNLFPGKPPEAEVRARATDLSDCLSATAGAAQTDRGTRIVQTLDPHQPGGMMQHGDAAQARSREALRALREAVGEEAFQQWGLGVVASLQTPEVLRCEVHGEGVRCAPDDRDIVGDDALPRAQDGASGTVRDVWKAAGLRCSPSGREPSEQLARELAEDLSLLSHPGASRSRYLHALREAAEGLGLLRQALSAVQAVGGRDTREDEPARIMSGVRRLTVKECERLMGVSDDWTNIPFNGKPAADGPRYAALGNSIAVPCLVWIFERLAFVDKMMRERDARAKEE